MAASTAPGVKAALLNLLRADALLSGVQIEYADPGASLQQESIFYGRTTEAEKPDALGQRKQRESYDIEIYVYVATDSDDSQTCEERCWALVAEIESTVRANNGRSGALSTALGAAAGWVVYGGTVMTPFSHSGQRVAEGQCKVHVEAIK